MPRSCPATDIYTLHLFPLYSVLLLQYGVQSTVMGDESHLRIAGLELPRDTRYECPSPPLLLHGQLCPVACRKRCLVPGINGFIIALMAGHCSYLLDRR